MRNKTSVGRELTENPDFRNMKYTHFMSPKSESAASK